MSKMLQKDPVARPSIADILQLSSVQGRLERAVQRTEVAEEERAMRRRFTALEAGAYTRPLSSST